MSPFATAQGIRGIEAEHVWNNGLVLNKQVVDASHPHPWGSKWGPARYSTQWPLVMCERITGLHGLPEADDNRAPATGRIGELVYPSFPRGRTITYEGSVYGRTADEMRQGVASLRAAFSDRSNQGQMVVRPHPAVGGASFYFYARTLAFDADDEQSAPPETLPSAFRRGFVLSLRQGDPRYFFGPQVNTGDVGAGGTPTVTNAGNAPTDFGIIVQGPVPDDLVFERYGNPDARKLLFNNVGLAGGDSLFLNYGARSLRRISDNRDFSGKMVFADSTWWDEGVWGLHPGGTVVRCAGGGTWQCFFNPASW